MKPYLAAAIKAASLQQKVAFLDALRHILSFAAPKNKVGTPMISDLDMMCATHQQMLDAASVAQIAVEPGPSDVRMWLLVGSEKLEVAQNGPDFLILAETPPLIAPQPAWFVLHNDERVIISRLRITETPVTKRVNFTA